MHRTRLLAFFVFLAVSTTAAQEAGIVTTYVGGVPNNVPALTASLSPWGLALDSLGSLYVAGTYNIFRISADGILTNFAGTGGLGWWYMGPNDEGVSATACGLFYPRDVAIDASGNIYLSDSSNCVIRRVDAGDHSIHRVAGTYWNGFAGDGGPALSARLNNPTGIDIDGYGNIYFCDTSNNRIRKIDAVTKIITTVAGNGTSGGNPPSGDGGLAVNAPLHAPTGIAVDAVGNLYITDFIRVRRVDAVTGIITTFAGGGSWPGPGDGGPATGAHLEWPQAVELDDTGDLLICENYRVRHVNMATRIITTIAGTGLPGITGDGGPAVAAKLYHVQGVTVDAAGNVLISELSNSRVRKIDALTGIITTIAGNGWQHFSGDGGPATEAQIGDPGGTVIDAEGNLYLADTYNNRVRKIDALTHVITTVAGNGADAISTGDGGPAIEAAIGQPQNVTVDSAGNLYIAQYSRVRRVNLSTGIIATYAGTGTSSHGGDGGPAANATFSTPTAMTVDENDNLFICDGNNERIRRIDAVTGIITTVAGTGAHADSGDGGPATLASLYSARGIVFGPDKSLFVINGGTRTVRRIDPGADGLITGEIDEVITRVAGGGSVRGEGTPGLNFQFWTPMQMVFDSIGNLYIAENWRAYVWMVSPGSDGVITGQPDETVCMVAWSRSYYGLCGDGGPALGACYSDFWYISIDSSGNLFVSDNKNRRIRRIELNRPPVANAGPDLILGIGQVAEFDGSASTDPDGSIVSYEWSFGDNSFAVGVTVSHSYVAIGDYVVTLKVTDEKGSTDTDTAVVQVKNSPPVAVLAGPVTGVEGSGVTFSAAESTDADGDPLQYRWDFDNSGTWDTPYSSSATANHTWADDYSGTVVVEVYDGYAVAAASTTVTVANANPVITTISGPVDPVPVGVGTSLVGNFTDAGTPDIHTAMFSWGDGTSSAGIIDESGGSGTATGSHVYFAPGVYRVTLTVTDDDGGTATKEFLYAVIYDPTGSFVTGAGHFTSPAGAYILNPAATGLAGFGFVSKYQKGATTPQGNTQFRFHAGDFTFSSTVYEWLVISGARAQYKGTGMINGAGVYGFMLTAIDGQVSGGGGVDRFRIKIWDIGTGIIVYDNQMGAPDDGAVVTALTQGSITIHK